MIRIVEDFLILPSVFYVAFSVCCAVLKSYFTKSVPLLRYRQIRHNEAKMLRLFDIPQHESDGVQLEIAPTKPAALALFLAIQGDWVDRERLMLIFAPDLAESAARHHVRVLLNRARQLGWTANLEAEPTRVRLIVPTDVKAFREAVGRGDHLQALALHQKPLLAGFRVDAAEFEAWCLNEREAFVRAWTDAALKRARQLQESDPGSAAKVLKSVLEQDNLAEDVLHAYLEAAYLAGNRDEAMRVFEAFRARLKTEFQLEPLQTTLNLLQTIRDAKPLTLSNIERTLNFSTPIKVLRPPRLAGRKHELEQIRASNASIVLIAAEPGAGKTRLLEEAIPNAIWLRCTDGLESVPYQPVIEFVRAQLPNIPNLGAYIEDLARLIPEIMPGATQSPADPSSAKARLLEALARLLEADARVLVFDDLQWADSSSLELLTFLVHRGKNQIYGAYRLHEKGAMLEQTLHGLSASGKLETHHLQALDVNAMRDLLADLIGIVEGPERFSKWLSTRSNGNVFFALEMLKSLFENGVLEIRDGDWHTALDEITNDYSELEVPPRVTQLIARRFARLNENTQRLLSLASVVGASFETKSLASLTGLSQIATIDALEEAEKHGFVIGQRFSHDLFRQILYQQIPSAKREYFHGIVAQAINGQVESLIVAEHWRKAGQLTQAWKLELNAAKDQFERGLLTAGFETLASLLNAPNSEILRLEALILAGTYMIYLDLDRSDNMLLEALNTPQISSEQRLHTNLSLSDNAVYRGDMVAATDYIEQASHYIQTDSPLELKLMYGFARLEAMLRSGQFAAADALLPEVYALEPNNLKTSSYEAQLRFYQGQHRRAAQIFEQIRAQDPNCVYTITLENDLAVAYWWIGELKKAEHEIMQSLEHWQGSSHVEALSLMNLGFIRLSQGRFADALASMNRAKEIGTVFGSITFQGDIENRLGVIYFQAGRLSEALPHLLKAVELMRQVGDPYRHLSVLSILVSVYAAMNEIVQAEQTILEAKLLLEKTQNLVAKNFLTQGQALIEFARGNSEKARVLVLEVEKFAREFELQEFLCTTLLFRAKLEPDPQIHLTEMLKVAVSQGFVFQEFLAAKALNDKPRADKILDFLVQHAPKDWF
jgi:DNA-binding SARP family transcriptional activator/tetratricopeptide (TPR) repeat protein